MKRRRRAKGSQVPYRDGESGAASRPTLLALATVTRNEAQRLSLVNMVLYFASIVLCAGAVAPTPQVAWALVTVAFAIKVVSVVVASRGDRLHELSRKAQRLALLEDSTGKLADPFQTVELRRQIGVRLEADAHNADYAQPYYRSTHEAGPRRLAENMQQSSFWSRHLLDRFAKILLWGLLTSSGIVGIIVFILLVVAPGAPKININPYVLSLAALTLAMGMVDYAKLYFACTVAVRLLGEVDHRLDNADLTNSAALLANFADYGIASVTAPPIPYAIYLKNRSYLVELWAERHKVRTTVASEASAPAGSCSIAFEGVTSFGHLTKDQFSALVVRAAKALAEKSAKRLPEAVRVSPLRGQGPAAVFELRLYQNEVLWRQLVLRLHTSPTRAAQELETLKRVSAENVDILSYLPLEEPFVSQGALFYYHANIQTNDELCPVDDFVARFLASPNTAQFASYFNKLLQGLTTFTKSYERIEQYSVSTLAEAFPSMQRRLPPALVLDLRDVHLKFDRGTLAVLRDAGLRPIGGTLRAGPSDQPTGPAVLELRVVSIDPTPQGGSTVNVEYGDTRCRCLLGEIPAVKVGLRPGDFLTVELDSPDRVQTVAQFLATRCALEVDPDAMRSKLAELMDSGLYRMPLHYAFRHTDLHCDNCLVSRSNFKILDIGDSSRGLIYCDLARLEISLLSRLADRFRLSSKVVARLLEPKRMDDRTESEPVLEAIRDVLLGVRGSFESALKIVPQEGERVVAYFLECCDQVSFSVLSPKPLRGGAAGIVRYWLEQMSLLIQRSHSST